LNQSILYWKEYVILSRYESLISIPAIIISGLTGLTSLGNMTYINPTSLLSVVTTILAVITTIITSLGKYFNYSERALRAKDQAKGLSEISRRIRLNNIIISNDTDLRRNAVLRMTDDIYKNLDILGRDVDDLPISIQSLMSSLQEEVEILNHEVDHNLKTERTVDESQPSSIGDSTHQQD
jgi:hypothetical protein